MTIREFVSVVRNSFNSISEDMYISSEYIYNVALSIAQLLTKRESDSRKVLNNTSFFSKVDCFELEEVSVSSCGFGSLVCDKIMKSVMPLPEVFTTSYGSLLFVMNINNTKNYIESNPIVYSSISKQKFKPSNTGYFWINNNYLYIPNTSVEVVSLLGLFQDAKALNDIVGGESSKCFKILDSKMPLLPYLESSVIEMTIAMVSKRFALSPDANSNLNQNIK